MGVLKYLPTMLLGLAMLLPAQAAALEAGMPNPPGGPTVVDLRVFVADIVDLNEMDEAFQAELIVLAEWDDPRLAFDAEAYGSDRKLFQGGFKFDEVFAGWWPSLLFVNEIGSGDLNALQIEVFSDGRVRSREQRNITLETPMQLRHFPFDTQVLEAELIAFGDTNEEVVLRIHPAMQDYVANPDLIDQNVNIAQWSLRGVTLSTFDDMLPYLGEAQEVSVARLGIVLQRDPTNIIWKVLVPMIALVALMWAVFWMDIHDLSDRLNICFIGILTIVAYHFVIDATLPRIAYITLTDTVVFYSFLVMCLTILESLIVVSLSRSDHDHLARKVDRMAQWLFPAMYIVGLAAIGMYFTARAA